MLESKDKKLLLDFLKWLGFDDKGTALTIDTHIGCHADGDYCWLSDENYHDIVPEQAIYNFAMQRTVKMSDVKTNEPNGFIEVRDSGTNEILIRGTDYSISPVGLFEFLGDPPYPFVTINYIPKSSVPTPEHQFLQDFCDWLFDKDLWDAISYGTDEKLKDSIGEFLAQRKGD